MAVTCPETLRRHAQRHSTETIPVHGTSQQCLVAFIFSTKFKQAEMDNGSRRAEEQAYSANLDYTLKELQRKVKEHEDELQRVRRATTRGTQTGIANW